MNSLTFSFLAAMCTSLASLFFRKNTEASNTSRSANGYLVLFYLTSFILSLIVYKDIWETKVNFIILAIGACVGVLNSTLMSLTSQALKRGPAGLTFAFQNASAIFPGLILFVIFGSDFGFSCSYLQLLGMALVLVGLFLGTKKEASSQNKPSSRWLNYALACFIVQILALTFIQARCILFNCTEPSGFFSKLPLSEADDLWFMPGQFGVAFILQIWIFFREKTKIKQKEILYGSLGGVANFASTCLLLLATKFALPLEKGILFPLFAVASMILCNIWAKKLYKEHFNLKTNALCSFGIFMAIAN